jgi:hypothetical protein
LSIRDSALIRARAWARRRGWRRALFGVLVVVQLLHLGEHSVQMVQLHLLHLPPAEARGLVSPLDVEKVHFVWNALVLGAIGWLLTGPVRTAWLGAAAVWTALHAAEHGFLLWRALVWGLEGQPGILGAGGWLARHGRRLAGLTAWSRPTIHFAWNVGEVALILVAFVRSLGAVTGAGAAALGRATRPPFVRA